MLLCRRCVLLHRAVREVEVPHGLPLFASVSVSYHVFYALTSPICVDFKGFSHTVIE